MTLQMFGCSHHNSSVQIRERLAFSPVQASEALDRFRARFPSSEAVLLSTCNRVEVYTASDSPTASPSHEEVVGFLAEFHGLKPFDIFSDLFEQSGEGAVRHLFTVAASLDSMVVGEPQILAQVKQAYQLAELHHSTGPITHSVFQAALRVAKRVTTETAVHAKRVSVPSVAIADFGRHIFERFDDKNILVIGAGELGDETLRYLRDEGAGDITVVNRSRDRAEALASKWNGKVAAWQQLDELLVAADIVISTTGASRPIVTRDHYQRLKSQRKQRPLFILDLAVPRDFDPTIGDHSGVYLYSIDDLQAACERNRQERDSELPAAMAIIEQETQLFMAELNHRASTPIIRRLREGWQEQRDQELARLFSRLPELDERQREEVTQAFERYVNKLLHPPLQSLRDESRSGSSHGLVEALKRLFLLKD